MTSPFLTIKFEVPRQCPGEVRRLNLFKWIEHWKYRRLILLRAPAGSGKTVFMASWLRKLQEGEPDPPKISWFALDKADNNVSQFFLSLADAFEAIDPALASLIRPFGSPGDLTDVRLPMTLALNHLMACRFHSILAVDNYHLLTNPLLQSALTFFIEHLPATCHLLLGTRTQPDFPLPRMQARGQMIEIGLPDLLFTKSEIERFLHPHGGTPPTQAAAQSIYKITEGWIAGVNLLAAERSELALHEYLEREIMENESDDIRLFLIQTAVLGCFNFSLCDYITNRSDSRQILPQLERSNVFLLPIDHKPGWYRYCRFFESYLSASLPASIQFVLHKRASRWHQKNGLFLEAFNHATAGRYSFDSAEMF